jgi:hypothetical protein
MATKAPALAHAVITRGPLPLARDHPRFKRDTGE